MEIFISWSGNRSKLVALALRDWLEMVVQQARPWCSDTDLDLGKRFSQGIAERLDAAQFGIACVTSENVSSPWLLFEAGAIAKSVEQGRLVPVLLGLTPSQLLAPLSQFQAVEATRDGITRLVLAIRDALPGNAPTAENTMRLFDLAWPVLATRLADIPESVSPVALPEPADLLAEILAITRRIDHSLAYPSPAAPGLDSGSVRAWLQQQLLEIEEELLRIDTLVRFYNERGTTMPLLLEEQHRTARYRRGFITQAIEAIQAMEENSRKLEN